MNEIEKIMIEDFKNSCKILLKEDLKDYEFEFIKCSIQNFLHYLSCKRIEENEEKS